MIELLKKDKKTGKVTFVLKNSTPALANALRRAMMEAVPTMAVDSVEFVQNDGVLYDEMVAHRLGLIPLTTDLKGYDVRKPGDELSAKNSVKLTLKAKGPCTVYAEDLKSKDPKIKPVHPKIPIAKLLKGQEIELMATAVLGVGKEHVKFSPCLAWYTYKPKVTVNNNHKDFEKFREKYPPQVFSNGKIDAKLIEQHNLFEACEGVNDDIVKIEYDPETFIFNIEPWGQLSPAEILACAADHLSNLCDDFVSKLP
ncbi:DNA-directed RNA polymerase subunit D [Candidatus Woesearchaeota archaeon]|nr:DNA-directed RNA polymerase subunit D [Candidatus Woesearchaeota archaeon]MBW3016604.1 DNA-directed RNA polymerase subunit D [Candidatus Woesearchaeota archaeon]